MTIKEIEKMDRATITPDIAAAVLGVDPQWIRVTARTHPEWIRFPILIVGNRTKIIREPFIKYVKGEAIYGPEGEGYV